MFTYCFNNEFISIFFISLLCILYFYDDERCKMNFPVRDNKVLLYCIVLYCIVLYCIVLYCIVLYCIVLYCIVLYCIVCAGNACTGYGTNQTGNRSHS